MTIQTSKADLTGMDFATSRTAADKAVLIQEKLISKLSGSVVKDAPMCNYTSWKIGGVADWLISPADLEDIELVLAFCGKQHLPLTIIGKGTNLLVSDLGIEGIVLQIGDGLNNLDWLSENLVWAEAGVSMAVLAKEAAKNGLSGLEWAIGIPGNLGGAMMMNAGAYGSNISNYVTKIQVLEYVTLDEENQQAMPPNLGKSATKGKVLNRILTKGDLNFGYRNSGILKNQVVVAVELKLKKGNREKSEAEMRELLKTRSQNQPLEFPSAGSVFVNPEGDHAGRLVEAAGCKGLKVGGAEVSLKHGNFIINAGGATAKDVLALIALVQAEVLAKFGVKLETEVRKIGRET